MTGYQIAGDFAYAVRQPTVAFWIDFKARSLVGQEDTATINAYGEALFPLNYTKRLGSRIR